MLRSPQLTSFYSQSASHTREYLEELGQTTSSTTLSRPELVDMYARYLPPTTPGFQSYITRKQEFRELAALPQETIPTVKSANGLANKFIPFRHQKFSHRILRAYPNAFIMSETGTGKTCEVLGHTEYVLRERQKALMGMYPVDEQVIHYRKIVVLVKNSTLKQNFREQIICKCSDGRYITENLLQAKPKGRKRIITDTLRKAGYELNTYWKFAKSIQKRQEKGDYSYIDEYSDTIFWIDESQNLNSESSGRTVSDKDATYNTLHELFHGTATRPAAQRIQVIQSSATPMINETNQMIKLINLFPGRYIPPHIDLDTITLEEYEPYIRGLFLYIREADTGIDPVYQVNPRRPPAMLGRQVIDVHNGRKYEYTSQIISYDSVMSPFQTYSYGYAIASEQPKSKNKSFYLNRIQASNFVFPDGYWGGGISRDEAKKAKAEGRVANIAHSGRAFNRYVESTPGGYKATKEFEPYLRNRELVRMMSCKYGALLDLLDKDPGNTFVYEEEVEGSGAVVLSLCMRGAGYELFDANASVFIHTGTKSDKMCGMASDTGAGSQPHRIDPNFPKALRYCIFTRKTSEAKFEAMWELFNSPENVNGEYIKVFISSRVGRDGMNLNNTPNIHLMGGQWHESGMHQAISRAIRAKSFELLIEILTAAGLLSGRLPVKIYKHAAIPGNQNLQLEEKYQESVDIHLYGVAESKDRRIKRIMRFNKQCAIGCQIHHARNIRPGLDGSKECDYDVCNYTCSEPDALQDPADYSTYNAFFAPEDADNLIPELIVAFQKYTVLSLVELQALFPQYSQNSYVILLALNNLIYNRTPVRDRFGYVSYLAEDQSTFFLKRGLTEANNYSEAYYANNLTGVSVRPLQDITKQMIQSVSDVAVQRIRDMRDPVEAREYLNTLEPGVIAKILEDVLLRYVQAGADPDKADLVTQQVLGTYQTNIFDFNKPVAALEQERYYVAQMIAVAAAKGKILNVQESAGPIKDEELAAAVANQTYAVDRTKPMVYIHTLLVTSNETLSSHGQARRLNKFQGENRILDTTEGFRWRDFTDEEYLVYRVMMRAYQNQNPARQLPIYGEFEPTGGSDNLGRPLFKFVIVDKTKEKPKRPGRPEKNRSVGADCLTSSLPYAMGLIYKLKIPEPTGVKYKFVDPVRQRTDIYQRFVADGKFERFEIDKIMSDPPSEILRMVHWVEMRGKGQYKLPDLCRVIQDFMLRNNMVANPEANPGVNQVSRR